jgi:hypothetical protein
MNRLGKPGRCFYKTDFKAMYRGAEEQDERLFTPADKAQGAFCKKSFEN